MDCSDLNDDAHERLHEDGEAHGLPHLPIHGIWMTPTDRCFIACHDNQGDAVYDLGPLQPGRYEVDGEDIDEGALGLMLVTPSGGTS